MLQSKPAAKMGRPSLFTPEIATRICDLLVLGHSLRKICKRAGFPSQTTVLRWLQSPEREDFRLQYARARSDQADTLADEIHDIACDKTDPVDHRRLQIDAFKWLAGKLRPKKYGEKLELSGSVGIPLTDEQLDARIAQLLAEIGVGKPAGGEGPAPAGEPTDPLLPGGMRNAHDRPRTD
jgi:hypothetical protein